MSQFGFLSKFDFLQTWASFLISNTNPAVTHNIGKYAALHKAFYLSAIDDKVGDYLEFGVFRGSSFSHALRCANRMLSYSKETSPTTFYGFDSFQGFGTIGEDDQHEFYKDDNFVTELGLVERKSRKAAKKLKFQLVPGFFEQSLAGGASEFGIENARIIFIDSDTYESSDQAFRFCDDITSVGTIIVLDDFFSYSGRSDRGVVKAFTEFQLRCNLSVRRIMDYGMGGSVFIVSNVSDQSSNSR